MKKENSYIVSLEAKDIIRKQRLKKGFETKGREKWVYKGALDYSLEALKIEELDSKTFYVRDKKQYTNSVVNVTFKYAIGKKKYEFLITDKFYKFKKNCKRIKCNNIVRYKYMQTPMSTKKLRRELYTNGFKMNGKTYVRFKRSGGSSRVGKCLFIRKDLYKQIMKWSYMGLEYKEKEKMDLASMEAYIALTTSSIIDTINIDPKGILLIKDYESVFEDTVMATEYDDKTKSLITKPKKAKISNSIWDGESLLDKSIFIENGYGDKGFLLGRNRFFKSACFNTDIQGFFRDNNITNISQLNGITLAKDIKDIKMITTPSSIKFLKMAKEHKMFKVNGEYDKIKAFEYWCENVENVFGIVKYEKPPHNMHEMVNCHYQLLNTLPLSKNDVRELLGQTLDYIKLLKDDLEVFKYHIGIRIDNVNELDESSDIDFTDSNGLIYELLNINDDFARTKIFRKFKDNLLTSFKDNIRKGHILVNGNYSVLCGNAYEMLLYSINKFDGEANLGIDEVHNWSMDYDKELLGSRSPHVTMGNVWVCKNVSNEKLDKYFCNSKYIIHVNAINNNLLQILSGADYDSDTVMITDNNILVRSGKKIYGRFLVPNDFIPKKKVSRTNTIEDKTDLDIKTSKNLIGWIINLSQILNSIYWHNINNGISVEGLYELISQLDILSCIEIDKAKKESIVDSFKEIKNIMESKWIEKGVISRNKIKREVVCRPYFFKYVGEGKDYKFVRKDTPMDFLQEILDEEIPNAKKGKCELNFLDLLINESNSKIRSSRVTKILDKVNVLNNEINSLFKINLTRENRLRHMMIKKQQVVKEISKMKVDSNTIMGVFKRINNENKNRYGRLNKSGLLLLNVIYNSHRQAFIELLKRSKTDTYLLGENENGKIKIYDRKFKKDKI